MVKEFKHKPMQNSYWDKRKTVFTDEGERVYSINGSGTIVYSCDKNPKSLGNTETVKQIKDLMCRAKL